MNTTIRSTIIKGVVTFGAALSLSLCALAVYGSSIPNGIIDAKTYEFKGKVREKDVVTKSSKISFTIHVDSGNARQADFWINFNTADDSAIGAWWMGKGAEEDLQILLPKGRFLLRDMPPAGSRIRLLFDRDVTRDIPYGSHASLVAIDTEE